MSDSLREISRLYDEYVLTEEHPRSNGLFTIPEYPEYEPQRGMWSTALDAILTTLRYLAPATLLTLFWGHQSFLFKLLKHIDSAFRAIVFSSEEQKQSVIQWLSEAGLVRVEKLDTVWRHGWIVCGVLDAALPGACAGHPPTKLSLKHAQAIADHYLGVEPVFSRQELESNDSLSRHQEWKLATYLDRIRQALSKITPPVSKPGSQRTSPDDTQFTVDYVARGSGLSAAQVYNKMHFKIYPTAQQSLDPGEITILIKGPKDTYGMTVLRPLLGKAQLIRQKLLGLQTKKNYTENALPITQGARYLRSYGKNDMNKTYYIPKTKYDIDIEDELRTDHVKISYIVPYEGRYEIFVTSRGQNIVGSPFKVSASHNIIGILEKDNFCLENGEEIDIVDVKTDRKVVLRIVDFVTEKMLLRENGTLEKITDDEANILMAMDNTNDADEGCTVSFVDKDVPISEDPKHRFKKFAKKIVNANKVCKMLHGVVAEKQKTKSNISINRPRNQQDIPDIVNSTFNENKMMAYMATEKRDKFIIPENISVSLLTEKCEPDFMENTNKELLCGEFKENIDDDDDTCSHDSLEEYETVEKEIENNMQFNIPPSPNNPFLSEVYEQNYKTEKDLGAFVSSEYETNNSQNEETRDSSIKIIIDENRSMSPVDSNPFVEQNILIDRPKSPVFKIISGEIKSRDGYTDIKSEINEEMLRNEFINPFFMHQHQSELGKPLPTTDFIIGAPVSLPPLVRAASPMPELESLIITNREETNGEEMKDSVDDVSSSVFSTPLHTNLEKSKESHRMDNDASVSSLYHSLESNIIEIVNDSDVSNKNQLETYEIEGMQTRRNISPKKDIWDSAYVSIDDNNSSPDSNNNDNTPLCEVVAKQKTSSDDIYGLKHEDLSHMGPAEREIWQTCSELKDNIVTTQEEPKPSKLELKRRIFTPIIEESDRSLSSGIRDIVKTETIIEHNDADPVTVAFADLNDVYQEYFPNSENDAHNVDHLVQTTTENENTRVDSASDKADVKRHTIDKEGKISEVQANVTESVSVSQILRKNSVQEVYEPTYDNKSETQFGDKKQTNIVLERKKYWDDKIRQIEAKSEESTTQQKKRRLSSRHLRNNDSLTKRRGKQIVKNFLNAETAKERTTDSRSTTASNISIMSHETYKPQEVVEEVRAEVKLVDKWKKYWDNKLETETEIDVSCFRAKSPKTKSPTPTKPPKENNEDIIETDKADDYKSRVSVPVKQELPEEVYKAFETSPKRFFGTSRKQILSKIDTFLGKPSTEDKSSADLIGASQDSGLVSSRISLFHQISNSEDLSWSQRKSQSMHNIHNMRKNYEERSVSSEKELEIDTKKQNKVMSPIETLKNEIMQINKEAIEKSEKDKITLKNKRSILAHTHVKSFDESVSQELDEIKKEKQYVKKTIQDFNKHNPHLNKYNKPRELRKTSISKSEMDIFNKASNVPIGDDLDKYKSCDELPKINVKNFISLYESVSKTNDQSRPIAKLSRLSLGSQKQLQNISSPSGSVTSSGPPSISQSEVIKSRVYSSESINIEIIDTKLNSDEVENVFTTSVKDKETTYLSLSDIELEIIESSLDKSVETSPDNDPDTVKKDYKSRFKMAKQFFQSLEEISDEKKPPKKKECQTQNKSTESLENNRPKKRVKKKIKSHSMPSSEIAKIWTQMQDEQDKSNKLVKISEKFNVDDLFSDVMEGKLSRQGSLRGIPHKKAVLETFRSMENISNGTMTSYEMAMTQLNDIAKENQVKNAQSYLSEYPYLPTTEPSKYQSRLDTKASGLISLKELLDRKPRRNSVPDLRLNLSFTADL